jgi:hypothetical protein
VVIVLGALADLERELREPAGQQVPVGAGGRPGAALGTRLIPDSMAG